MERRKVLQSAIPALLLPWFSAKTWASTDTTALSRHEPGSAISIIQPRKPSFFPQGKSLEKYQHRLYQATMRFIQDHYSGRSMPIWHKPPEKVDLDNRIANIAYWVIRSVKKHGATYPVDPAWLMAQIMEESFFYEFAVSWSFASGICQFTLPTATSFGIVCPTTSRVAEEKLQQPEKAKALDRLTALRKRKNKLENKNRKLFRNQEALFRKSLSEHARGTTLARAREWLDALHEMDSLEESIRKARKEYRSFLQDNYKGKSLFNPKDLDFLLQFDERVTYKKPIETMVKMMSRYMKGRNGNILAATAGYNAGLSRTYYPHAVYKPYGIIPNYDETVSYVSKIAVNHYEIVKRLT